MTAQRDRTQDLSAGLVALWCVLWLVVGVWTGVELWQLAGLGETVADSGRALDAAGSALQSLGGVPLVGDDTAELGTQIRENAAAIVVGAGEARSSTRQLSVLLGLTIALVPSVPALALFVAVRRGRLVAIRR